MYCERSVTIRILKCLSRLRPHFDTLDCHIWWEEALSILPPDKGGYLSSSDLRVLVDFQAQILRYTVAYSDILPKECRVELKNMKRHYESLVSHSKTSRAWSRKS